MTILLSNLIFFSYDNTEIRKLIALNLANILSQIGIQMIFEDKNDDQILSKSTLVLIALISFCDY